LDACIISLTTDMRDGAAYTALSRVRNLESLIIEMPEGVEPRDVFERAFRTADAVYDFLEAMGA